MDSCVHACEGACVWLHVWDPARIRVCVRVRVCVCSGVRVRVALRVCVGAFVRVHVCVWMRVWCVCLYRCL